MNERLIELLRVLAKRAEVNGEIYRAGAFTTAANNIKQLTYTINKGTLARLRSDIQQKRITGIASGIYTRIEEYVNTNTIVEATNAMLEFKLKDDLDGVLGVGPATIDKWIKMGVRSLSDLRRKVANREIELTTMQRYGLLHYVDLKKRLSRSTIERVATYIRSIVHTIQPSAKFDVVGSYRRGAQTSGDVDILVSHINATMLLAQLQRDKAHVATVSHGDNRITILWFYEHVLQVDILIADDYYAALSYFTGSDQHNIQLRHLAKRNKMRLNQTGLYKVTAQNKLIKIPLASERTIYEKLGIAYVQPKDR